MFVGYAMKHAGGVYRMWYPVTAKNYVSRDVTWLKRMYYQRKMTEIEISSVVDSGVRESDMVTTNTTPTVTPDPSGTETETEIDPIEDENKENEDLNVTLDSYCSMQSLMDDDDETIENESETESDNLPEQETVTRSGRVSRAPAWHNDYAALALTETEVEYQKNLQEMAEMEFAGEDVRIEHELAGVGAGIGGGFSNTAELKAMKYEEAMATDAEGWGKAVEEEHGRMIENNVWKPVPKSSVPLKAKILTSTWACKLKASGVKRARLNGRGYKQINGVHYDSSSIHSPVTNDVTVRIVFTLTLMAGWIGRISDVKGAFLKGDLDTSKEQMYMHVPKGFEKYYPGEVYLMLLKAIYGSKQAAIAFWKDLLKYMRSMQYERNGADPCLYFQWTIAGLVVWLSWVDDCMCWGPKSVVPGENKKFTSRFDCDDVGEVKEYVGCKIVMNKEEGTMKLVQPVMLQSFTDEFDVSINQTDQKCCDCLTHSPQI